MASLIVLIRIFLGWIGVWLLSKGVDADVVDFIQTDVTLHTAIADWATTIVGVILMGVQILWWRLSKRFGWST